MASLDAFTLFVVVVQLVAAAGIVGFWLTAGRAKFDEPWRPPGFALHERAFTVPDCIAATLMVASAALTLTGRPLGRSLALLAAGMLLFLGIIDAVYMKQNDLFRPEHDGRMHAAIVTAVLTVAVLMFLAYRF
jgi:hypothetical protein